MTHVFRHPKFLKELRKLRNKLDQVISKQQATASSTRAPGPGLKQQATSSIEPQASSNKLQAPSTLVQGSSHKRQAP
jgi:mRNA-degrading endonuclease RelE of RelBE toxin-antitoxin system